MDNRTIDEVRKNEDKLINEIELLEQENKKYKEVIDIAIKYLETKRVREKAIIDVDVLEGILKEVEHE